MNDFARISIWYVVILGCGVAMFYAAGTGAISPWFLPVAIFLLIGWLFSLGFVIFRVVRGRWPKADDQ